MSLTTGAIYGTTSSFPRVSGDEPHEVVQGEYET